MRSGFVIAVAATGMACGMSVATGAGNGNLDGDAGSGALLWYATCGDPVCGGHRDHGVARCTTEAAGRACTSPGARCDPGNDCDEDLLCSTTDPRLQVGGCPISRASYKEDIHFLTQGELEVYNDQLLALPLATYRYRQSDAQKHLGFLIDGHESLVCVEPERDRVDLYSYASMAVAALQVQARQIDELRKEVASLRADVAARRAAAPRQRAH